MKYKHGDIVVVESSSDSYLPINSVVQLENLISPKLLIIRTFQKNTFQILSIFLEAYNGKLRLATQQEQFLYYIFGPHTLEQ